jgi:hypothetical protein
MLFIRRYVDSYHACIIHLKIQQDQKVGKNKIQVANSQLGLICLIWQWAMKEKIGAQGNDNYFAWEESF